MLNSSVWTCRSCCWAAQRHFIFFDYACRADQTEVQLNDEAEAYVWVPVDEALRLPMGAYTERAIRAHLAQQAEK